MSATPDRVDDAVLDDLRHRLRATRTVTLAARAVGPAAPTPATSPSSPPARTAAAVSVRCGSAATGRPWFSCTAGPTRSSGSTRCCRCSRTSTSSCRAGSATQALPTEPPGMSTFDMADLVADALAELGIERYVVSGGDIGSSVAEHLAASHAEAVSALHFTDVPYSHLFAVDPDDLSQPERDYLDAGRTWQMAEGAYALEQATKPHTLAAALGDSPVGLLAWILEKLRSWSDSDGDVETVYSRDELLTWVTLYWVSGAIGTSFAPYSENTGGITMFPGDLVPAPREFA